MNPRLFTCMLLRVDDFFFVEEKNKITNSVQHSVLSIHLSQILSFKDASECTCRCYGCCDLVIHAQTKWWSSFLYKQHLTGLEFTSPQHLPATYPSSPRCMYMYLRSKNDAIYLRYTTASIFFRVVIVAPGCLSLARSLYFLS